MRNNFVAIDFETSYGHIPCSIGIAEFVDGKKVSEYYSLIKPIDLKFSHINSGINNIYLEDVLNEREFNEIWFEIAHYFTDRNVVAHNASTDISILNKTLDYYKIDKPNYRSYCTLKVAQNLLKLDNYKLSTVARNFQITQNNYHNALDDAFVCGQLLLNLFIISNQENQVENLGSYYFGSKSSTFVEGNYFFRANIPKSDICYSKVVNLDLSGIAGKTFVVSGVFTKFNRDDLKKAIEDNGGKVGSSISAKTDFVIAGDNMGPAKLEKATKLNVAIISEDDFISMLG